MPKTFEGVHYRVYAVAYDVAGHKHPDDARVAGERMAGAGPAGPDRLGSRYADRAPGLERAMRRLRMTMIAAQGGMDGS